MHARRRTLACLVISFFREFSIETALLMVSTSPFIVVSRRCSGEVRSQRCTLWRCRRSGISSFDLCLWTCPFFSHIFFSPCIITSISNLILSLIFFGCVFLAMMVWTSAPYRSASSLFRAIRGRVILLIDRDVRQSMSITTVEWSDHGISAVMARRIRCGYQFIH